MPRVRTIKVQQNSTSGTDYTIHSAIADKLARSSKLFTSNGYQGDEDMDGNIVVNGNVLTKSTFSKSHVYGYTVCFLDGKTPVEPEKKNEELTVTLETLLTKGVDVEVSDNPFGTPMTSENTVDFYPNPYYKFNLVYNKPSSGRSSSYVSFCKLKLSHLDSIMKNGEEIFIIFKCSMGGLEIKKDTSFSKATYFGQLSTEDSISIKLDEHPHTAISILKLNDWYYVRDLGVGEDVDDTPSQPDPGEGDTGTINYMIDSCSIYWKIGLISPISNDNDETPPIQTYAIDPGISIYNSLGQIPNDIDSPLTFPAVSGSLPYDWYVVYKVIVSPVGKNLNKTFTPSDFANMAINSFQTVGGDVVAVGDKDIIEDLAGSTSLSVSVNDGSSKTIYVMTSKNDTVDNITKALAFGVTDDSVKTNRNAKLLGVIDGVSVSKTVSYTFTKKASSTGGGGTTTEGDYSMSINNMTWCGTSVGVIGTHSQYQIGTMNKLIKEQVYDDDEVVYVMDNMFTTSTTIGLLILLDIRLKQSGTTLSNGKVNANNVTITQLRINNTDYVPTNKKGSLVSIDSMTLEEALKDANRVGTNYSHFSESVTLNGSVSPRKMYVYFENVITYGNFKEKITKSSMTYPYQVQCEIAITLIDEKYSSKSDSNIFKAWLMDKSITQI